MIQPPDRASPRKAALQTELRQKQTFELRQERDIQAGRRTGLNDPSATLACPLLGSPRSISQTQALHAYRNPRRLPAR